MEQYVVINIEKTQTISAVLERHILRVDIQYENGKKIIKAWTPDNADPAKAMLNRELVSREYVDPLTDQKKMRTIDQAIRHRIEEAGIKRLRPGQNTALEIILTGSPETLNSLDEEGLDKWVNESMGWADKTWGKENIVTAVLHRDEKTPHIHLIVVPIVQGLSRRSKARDEMLKRVGKKVKTKKRNTTGNRLSANEVYSQPRLYAYHTTYAKEVGAHFGLTRGVRGEKGSRKNPQKSIDFNRELERQKLETEVMIAEMRSDYSETQVQLQTVTESLAIAQENLQKVNDDMALAQANLQQIKEAAAQEEERKTDAKKEADEEEFRLQEAKRLTLAEQKKHAALQESGLQLERQKLETETMIEEMRSDYSETRVQLQTVTESLAVAQENLQKVNDDMALAQANLQQIKEAAAQEEERKTDAKKEADEEEARLQEAKRLTVAEQENCAALKDKGVKLEGAIKQMEGNLEKGRYLEVQIAERENYFRSLGAKSLLDFLAKIPELIKKELTNLVNKYFKGEVIDFREREVPIKKGETNVNEKFIELKMKWDGGNDYILGVRELDASAWVNGKRFRRNNNEGITMPEIVSYYTSALSPEGKELVTSMYKKIESTPRKDDPVVTRLQKKYGEVAVSSVTPLKTNGKESGRMYHFIFDGKKRTAVYDVDSGEISISPGHVKQGTFYLSEWKTINGKPAVGVNNRVYSQEYRRLHKGHGIG